MSIMWFFVSTVLGASGSSFQSEERDVLEPSSSKNVHKVASKILKQEGQINTAPLERALNPFLVSELSVLTLEYAAKSPLELWDEGIRSKEAVLAGIQRDGRLFRNFDSLKGDKEVVLAAVQSYGWALQYASKELRGDREVVLVAVKNFGGALRYASKELKEDREIVLTAVQNFGGELRYAGDELKKDPIVVLAAVKNYRNAFMWASEELKRDKEFLLAIKQLG